MAKAFSPDTAGTLATDLAAYWRLEETGAAARVDEVGSSNLTATASPPAATGKVGSGCQFNGSSQYLSINDNAALSVSDIDFSIAFWVKFNNLNQYDVILGKWNNPPNGAYVVLREQTSNKLYFQVMQGSSYSDACYANTFGAVTTGVWYFVYVEHNASANTTGISVNNGPLDTVSWTLGVQDDNQPFRIGQAQNANYFAGVVDEVGLWKKRLSSQELTDLYNSGNGNTYMERGGGAPTTGAELLMMLAVQ